MSRPLGTRLLLWLPAGMISRADQTAPVWLAFVTLLGLYLTAHGYHSRDNDQAYRLPLLLHRQDPNLYADDPFVRAFDAFNPHRGYLALLDVTSGLVGLSAALALVYGATFGLTCVGLDGLARAAWPEAGRGVGVVAAALVLTAQAGNVGTNHLFEPLLLDRLLAQGFGWLALARVVNDPCRGAGAWAGAIAAACVVHPSLGLQLGMLLGASGLAWSALGRLLEFPPGTAPGDRSARGGRFWRPLLALALAVTPSLVFTYREGGRLLDGLPAEEMRLLAVMIQSPQHMMPQLWRLSQWLAWGCYPVLGLVALIGSGSPATWPPARRRLALVLLVNLIGLALAWVAVEGLGDLRVTLFQPFRMATLARGLCLVLLAEHWLRLWRSGATFDRARAVLLATGLVGDWTLVVATAVELGVVIAPRGRWVVGMTMLASGLLFLSRHDTEAGHLRLLAALVLLAGLTPWLGRGLAWTSRRAVVTMAVAWIVPLLGFCGLTGHCRFGETPITDVERLAVWCREHTPESARFLGPPGPKTFRLWSRRSLVFNRAAGPYHAAGLADWSARFRDHVDFTGTTAAFARAYLADRQGLEGRYLALPAAALAALAERQGASHVVAAASLAGDGPLERLHVEGKWAVYRVRGPGPSGASSRTGPPPQPRPLGPRSAGTG